MFFIALHTAPTFPGSEGRQRMMTISDSIMAYFNRDMVYSRSMEGIFADRNALVIGGTGGIGRAVALELALLGAHMTVHGGSSQERLDGTLEAIRLTGAKAEGFLCQADTPGAAERILAQAPPPDILVCAWGPFSRSPIEALGPDDWRHAIENNLIFPGLLISSVLPDMIKHEWGRIVLFGGTNTDTIRGFTTTVAYSAAKTALGVLAKSAAKAAGPFGVSCNVLCPGLTDTEYTGPELQRYNKTRSPGGKVLNSGEIARIGVEILKNPQINGAIIPVDHGLAL
jgi:3-oxoacyl-[acyl-carrier protein] reductase